MAGCAWDDPFPKQLASSGAKIDSLARALYFRNRRHRRERLRKQILNDTHIDGDSGLGEVCVVPVMCTQSFICISHTAVILWGPAQIRPKECSKKRTHQNYH